MNFRKLAFNLVDSMRGGLINAEIKRLERSEIDKDFYNAEKRASMSNFLASLRDVPSYKDLDMSKGLEQFPVIQKKTIQSDRSNFLSKAYQREDLIKVSTSGSYGLPAEYYLTRQKKAQQLAEVIHYGRKVGYDVGVKHMYIRSVVHKSAFKQYLQNEHYLGCKDLDDRFLQRAREVLKGRPVKVIIGFPTAISLIADYCLREGDTKSRYSIKGVITSSENLSEQQREIMKKAWGDIGICSRYSTEEFGVLACQYEAGEDFLINSLNYHIEILKVDSDLPCSEGEVGRIVVTDLHSFANPLVRYDTGDLGLIERRETDEFGSLLAFKSLSGRGVQVIVTPSGELKYPLYLDTIMERFEGSILQYQLIQETKSDFRLLVIPKDPSIREVLNELNVAMLGWLGEGANLNIEVVKSLEMLPSGKRPYVINKTL